MRVRILGVLLTLMLVPVISLTALTPAVAAPQVSAHLVDASLIGGQQHSRLTGKIPSRVSRPVLLQRYAGGWKTVSSGKSTRTGGYSLTDSMARTGTYRVVAPRIRVKHRTWPTLTSTPRRTQLADHLERGERLTAENFIGSPDGKYQLRMQLDGNLVLYGPKGAEWSTSTNGSETRRADFQTDGNFVVRTATKSLWSSTTENLAATSLTIQDDGNLVVYAGARALWSRITGIIYDRLGPGDGLAAGQQLFSPDHTHRAVMQGDGNLVVYRGSSATWSSNSVGSVSRLVMQGDGNLVLYRASGPAVWHTSTGGFSGGSVRMQNDGNLVLYRAGRPLWASNQGTLFDQLRTGDTLESGQELNSADHRFRLVMQGDGNLVMYEGTTAKWSSGTQVSGSTVVMQSDGNLVVYAPGGRALWSSSTAPASGARLVVQTDGNLVIYSGARALWDRNRGRLSGGETAPSTALARGQSWVDAGVPYNQRAWFTNTYGNYRQDCSGFVSMMWNLGTSYVTSTLPQVSHQISKDELQPGDILLNPSSHVLLFAGWVDAGHTSYWAYEQTPPRAQYRKVPYPYWSGYGDYRPYRKN